MSKRRLAISADRRPSAQPKDVVHVPVTDHFSPRALPLVAGRTHDLQRAARRLLRVLFGIPSSIRRCSAPHLVTSGFRFLLEFRLESAFSDSFRKALRRREMRRTESRLQLQGRRDRSRRGSASPRVRAADRSRAAHPFGAPPGSRDGGVGSASSTPSGPTDLTSRRTSPLHREDTAARTPQNGGTQWQRSPLIAESGVSDEATGRTEKPNDCSDLNHSSLRGEAASHAAAAPVHRR